MPPTLMMPLLRSWIVSVLPALPSNVVPPSKVMEPPVPCVKVMSIIRSSPERPSSGNFYLGYKCSAQLSILTFYVYYLAKFNVLPMNCLLIGARVVNLGIRKWYIDQIS
jgi:hypothetical protein